MGKVSGSYESVVRGVSEQNPQMRRSGQHFAQVNMISDPVRGLARRHGSYLQDEMILTNSLGTPVPGSQINFLAIPETSKTRVFPFFVGGVEYDLVARTEGSSAGLTCFAFCFNKETRNFVPVEFSTGDPTLTLLASGGISAVANVGRFLYLAGNTIVPTATTTLGWADAANQALLVGWVRGGAYSRTFKVSLTKTDNTKISGEYKTVGASYPGVLDTSDILTADPDYQKKVNDRVNAYNSAVTAYIGEAAEDITPENIAQKLVDALVVAGVNPGDISRIGAYVAVNSVDYKEIEMDDGGDGSLVRGVGNTVENLDLVSAQHFTGKIVKVEPEDSTGDPIYLKAFAKDEVSTGWTEVVWREAAGVETLPTSVFAMATIEAGTMYIAGGPTELATLSGVEVPGYKANNVGDDVSSPIPTFFDRRIDFMTVWQDRLIVGSGATLFFSRPGDYLNWFRQSVLSIQDDDPWEGFALGADDDIIKYSTLYDRSLLLYGKRFQYVVNGRATLTPTNAAVTIVSSYEDATEAAPRSSGNFVFYAKSSGRVRGRETTSLHQVQPGIVTDVSDSYSASQQLDTYLAGKPVEIVTLTAPNMVALRTDKDRSRVYIYSYLDNPNTSERLFDSWSLWEWAAGVGNIAGLSRHESDVLMYMIKRGTNSVGEDRIWFSVEAFVRDTEISDYPYLDSLKTYDAYKTAPPDDYLSAGANNLDTAFVAIGRGPDEQFMGSPLLDAEQFEDDFGITDDMYAGYGFSSYVTPTNPYAKDRNDQAILSGRLTLGRVRVTVTDTGGLKCDVEARGTTRPSLNFIGRILGQPDDMIGRQPIVATDLSATIGYEVRECKYTLSAVRWLPLTINSIEWTGQFHFRTKRA